MKKWPLIIIMAAIVGLILAFIIGQILPKMRTTSSDIEVNTSRVLLIVSPAIRRLKVKLMLAACLC